MNKTIGRNLKALREYNRYTQEEIAEFLELKNRSTYANYETGEREAPLEVLEKCAALYGCELGMLCEENQASAQEMLVHAFRVDDIEPSDLKTMAEFKYFVQQYQKLDALLSR